MSPPLSPSQGIKISLNSQYLQLTTDFGLTVRFNGNMQGGESKHKHHAFSYIFSCTLNSTEQTHTLAMTAQTLFSLTEVILPSTYKTHVRGLCGNYDGRSNNEYVKPDGSLTRNLNEFGDSWRVGDKQGEKFHTSDLPQLTHLHKWVKPKSHYHHLISSITSHFLYTYVIIVRQNYIITLFLVCHFNKYHSQLTHSLSLSLCVSGERWKKI